MQFMQNERSSFTVNILLNVRAFIHTNTFTIKGVGVYVYWRLRCRATFNNSYMGIGGSRSDPDRIFVPSRCLGIPCITIYLVNQRK